MFIFEQKERKKERKKEQTEKRLTTGDVSPYQWLASHAFHYTQSGRH